MTDHGLVPDSRSASASVPWRPLALLVVGAAAVIAVLALVTDGYFLGLAQGLILTAAVALGTRIWLLSSDTSVDDTQAEAEDASRDALRSAARSGHVLGWVDHLEIASGEIDHLVITPHGPLAVDTAWHSNDRSRTQVSSHIGAASQAAVRARNVLRAIDHRPEVTPVVVVWGPGQDSLGQPRLIGDVHLVAGRDLASWLSARAAAPPTWDRLQARQVLDSLEAFKQRVSPTQRSVDRSSS